jgi:hypothetical protein
MRAALLLLALAIAVPRTAPAQVTAKPEVEQFNVAGLPKTPGTDKERELFALLAEYRKGDFATATRIHVMLAEYYREQGERAKFDDCLRQAAEAWAAGSAADHASAGSPGQPPFVLRGAFRLAVTHTDDLGITHTWKFFRDGTYAHSIADSARQDAGPVERGWYAVADGRMRLWQLRPATDRNVTFEFIGIDGRDGVILDGVRMKSAP